MILQQQQRSNIPTTILESLKQSIAQTICKLSLLINIFIADLTFFKMFNNLRSFAENKGTCNYHSGFAAYEYGSCPEIYRALDGVRYIAQCTKREEDSNKVKEDWKYVAMVLDRLFLWIFTVAVLVGSAGIILQAPALYDTRAAIDREYSMIEAVTAKPLSEQRSHLLRS